MALLDYQLASPVLLAILLVQLHAGQLMDHLVPIETT